MPNQSWIEFVAERLPALGVRLGEHLVLTGVSTGLAILIGVPLGIAALHWKSLRGFVLGFVGILQTIPSLALLTLLLVMMGKIGAQPAIIALTLYALLPIVRNTITGLEGISPAAMEAARGIGMTGWQQLRKVQLPLALPVIIAGIRTAAVIGVGIATLSAFIGAGGLGEFINRGLYLSNYRLILLGAIPAAVLALLVDFALGAVAAALDPIRRARRRSLADMAGRAVAVLLPVLLVGAAIVGYLRMVGDVTIGSKMFSESVILGHMMAMMIEEHTDLRVDERFGLGGTMICHGALNVGEIDLYAEYTGTGLTAVLHEPVVADPKQVYQTVSRLYREQFDIQWLSPFGFNNTYAVAVRRDAAEKNGWQKISDLESSAGRLKAGWTAEFAERPDGYPGLIEAYGFEFGTAVDIESGQMYDAIAIGEVDVIAAYSTDGRIVAKDLVLLEDDRRLFPPYFAAPVVNDATLERHPEIAEALAPLAGSLDDETMRELNLQVDEYKRSPKAVAREFLIKQGLLREP